MLPFFVLITLFAGFFFWFSLAYADSTIINPLKCNTIEECIDRVITLILYVATAVMPILIIYAAFLYMTSAGNPEKVGRAGKTIWYTVVGYAIILFSKAFVYIIKDIVGAT